jgi:hypothetical protein
MMAAGELRACRGGLETPAASEEAGRASRMSLELADTVL